MKHKAYQYSLPVHWASYLINGDSSALTEEDIKQCDEATKDMGRCVDVSEETYFRQYAGLGTEVATFTFIKPS